MFATKKPAALLMLAALLGFAPGVAFAQSRGCQFIGASKAGTGDITSLSNILNDTGGNLQVSLLPFEFNPGNPFGNATALVQMVTPLVNGRLYIGVYLRWFPHDGPGNNDQADFWAAWGASRLTTRQARIRANFISRVQQTDAFVASARQWANQNGVASKLDFVVIPVLEDTCQSRTAYRNILTAIRQQQVIDGTPTYLRRSCLTDSKYAFSLGVPLELHGRWADVKDRLGAGDTWSNDGTEYPITDFIRDQREAIARGVHVLYWAQAYNGHPRTRDNWAQRTVEPFAGPGGRAERRALRDVLSSR
jgi:hypothetical protein